MPFIGLLASRAARFAALRPRRALAVFLLVIVPLSVAGIGVQDQLHDLGLHIAEAPSGQMSDATREQFGARSQALIVMHGPRREADAQRRTLRKRLAHDGIVLLGPLLRRDNGTQLLVAEMHGDDSSIFRQQMPHLRKLTKESVRPPVSVHLGGSPDNGMAIVDAAKKDLKRFELIAAPLLLIILLLIFRTPLAAAMPLAIGATAIGATGGALHLINMVRDLDVFAYSIGTMMGLALGVDYALLVVSRFREELREGVSTSDATIAAATEAGETILSAALALFICSLTLGTLTPGDVLASASLGLACATLFSAFAGVLGLPALLSLIGHRLDAWAPFGRPGVPGEGRFARMISKPLKRPALVNFTVLAFMAPLVLLGLHLPTGPPNYLELSPESAQRRDYAAIGRLMGKDFDQPYQILLSAKNGRITDPDRLKTLTEWQQRFGQRSDVLAVFGPGEIGKRAAPTADARDELRASAKTLDKSVTVQRRVNAGIDAARDGVGELRAGLKLAAHGATLAARSGEDADTGAQQIATGLERARSGAVSLRAGLAHARDGATQLAHSAGQLSTQATALSTQIGHTLTASTASANTAAEIARDVSGARDGVAGLRQPAIDLERQLAATTSALYSVPNPDTGVRATRSRLDLTRSIILGRTIDTGEPLAAHYDGLPNALQAAVEAAASGVKGANQLSTGAAKLRDGIKEAALGARSLESGATRLQRGAAQLTAGIDRLNTGAGELATGLEQLAGGGRVLTDGVAQLDDGASRLAAGLDEGARETAPLASGLKEIRARVSQSIGKTQALRREVVGPVAGAATSGFLPMAVIDAGTPEDRDAAAAVINLDNGGNAALITIFGYGSSVRAGHPLRAVIEREASKLAKATRTESRVGGSATMVQDYERQVGDSVIVIVAVLSLVSLALLAAMLRSFWHGLIAVVLNLLTTGATFGLIRLLYAGENPLLSGPGYVNVVSTIAVFGIVFSLSIDYTLFLMTRMHQHYQRHSDGEAAISHGLRTTAGVVTGAAAVLIGVYLAFATSTLVTLQQIGLGLAFAILLDATVVRLVLLPSAMRIVGERGWSRRDRLIEQVAE